MRFPPDKDGKEEEERTRDSMPGFHLPEIARPLIPTPHLTFRTPTHKLPPPPHTSPRFLTPPQSLSNATELQGQLASTKTALAHEAAAREAAAAEVAAALSGREHALSEAERWGEVGGGVRLGKVHGSSWLFR